MSLVKTYSVFCDINEPGCRGWVAQTTDGGTAARSWARGHGWKRVNGQDICPVCQHTQSRKEERRRARES